MNFHVIAAGDSFNDTTMLAEANKGFLFHAPEAIKKQFPQFHVIGWVRQPVTIQPMVGDVVQVRRPLFNGKSVSAKIIQVGSQYEPIAPTLSVIPLGTTSSRVELGLPFLVQLPKNARFTPGEPVHLTLPKRPRPDIAL